MKLKYYEHLRERLSRKYGEPTPKICSREEMPKLWWDLSDDPDKIDSINLTVAFPYEELYIVSVLYTFVNDTQSE